MQRGRRIFQEGLGQDEILAVLPGNLEVPGGTLTCAGCHGRDGRGRPEGGVSPSKLTWHSLTRPYEVVSPSGRHHGPYDARSLKRAIAMGLDPAGNPLQEAMPRFRMSHRDMVDLVTYLQFLEEDGVPGVEDDTLQIGVVVGEGSLAEATRAAKETLEAWFEELNDSGGIFGRRVELVGLAPEDIQESTEVLALVGGGGETEELISRLERLGIPYLGAGGHLMRDPWEEGRHAFHLEAGPSSAGRALAQFAGERWPDQTTWIVQGTDPRMVEVGDEIVRTLKELGQPEPHRLVWYDDEASEEIQQQLASREGALFLLVPGERGRRLAQVLEGELLAPGTWLAGWTGPLERRTVHITLPVLPEDRLVEAVEAFRRLLGRHHLPTDHLSSRLAAVVAARVLVAGLETCGRGVDRQRLVQGLESLKDFETGLTRPMSFGPRRRTGLDGLYVVSFAAGASPRATWYEVRPRSLFQGP